MSNNHYFVTSSSFAVRSRGPCRIHLAARRTDSRTKAEVYCLQSYWSTEFDTEKLSNEFAMLQPSPLAETRLQIAQSLALQAVVKCRTLPKH